MKHWFWIVCSMLMLICGAGCAIDGGYVPRLPNATRVQWREYQSLPKNKVLVFAVDPNGAYAFGYASGKDTIKAAVQEAIERCNENRNEVGVLCRPEVYAVNGRVVYADMIRENAQQAK